MLFAGKYESNCLALRLALERADRVSEAYEVLAALVESEMALLLANCQVAGLGLAARPGTGWDPESVASGKDLSVLWKRATERRRSAENLARSLLAKYDRERDHWEDTARHTKFVEIASSRHCHFTNVNFTAAPRARRRVELRAALALGPIRLAHSSPLRGKFGTSSPA